jgi:glucosamine 6-phosphate synthetase-like amidotransferase/phosphosugar isomerase protein
LLPLPDGRSPLLIARLRQRASLLVGEGIGENLLDSDAQALIQITHRMLHLDEGGMVESGRDEVQVADLGGRLGERAVHEREPSTDEVVGDAPKLEPAIADQAAGFIRHDHAEAYAAGELKRDPLALVDEEMAVVAVTPSGPLLHRPKSNLQEVRARGGRPIVFPDGGTGMDNMNGYGTMLRVASSGGFIALAVFTMSPQLLAYHVAVLRGTDVDQPRNLAKSVTLE